MKKATLTAVGLVLLLGQLILAAPPELKIDREVRPSGQYVEMTPSGEGLYSVTYIGLSGVDAIPSRALRDSRLFLLDTRGLATGRYKFAAVGSSKEGDQVRVDFEVVIGNAPGPNPPGPNPPGPDPGPGPVDSLVQAFQEAYSKETDSDKAKLKDLMIELYKQTAELAKDEKAVTNWGQLFRAFNATSVRIGTSGKLKGIQTVSQKLMLERFPSDQNDWSKTMTKDDRVLAEQTYIKLADALKGVK